MEGNHSRRSYKDKAVKGRATDGILGDERKGRDISESLLASRNEISFGCRQDTQSASDIFFSSRYARA